jgi:putative transposase
MRRISKSKENGVIYTARLIVMDIHWTFKFEKHVIHQGCLCLYEKIGQTFWRTIGSYDRQGPSFTLCIQKLQKAEYYVHTNHCTIKYRNNLIEQDHRHIKRRFVKSAGFQTPRHASRTIKGIETIQAIYKQRRNFQTNLAFSVYNELQQSMATA